MSFVMPSVGENDGISQANDMNHFQFNVKEKIVNTSVKSIEKLCAIEKKVIFCDLFNKKM